MSYLIYLLFKGSFRNLRVHFLSLFSDTLHSQIPESQIRDPLLFFKIVKNDFYETPTKILSNIKFGAFFLLFSASKKVGRFD